MEFNVFRKLSDEELLRRMTAGDADAFGKLYDRRQSNVYRYALRMSGSSAFAEDVTQDVFIALMRDAHQFDETRGTVAAYLFGITRHRVLRKLERERTFISLTAQEESDENSALDRLFVTDPHPLERLEQQEMIETVQQAVLSLPTHYREVVVLCNLEELNYEQAAAVIGCPVGTVRSRLNQARAMLVEKLRPMQASLAKGKVKPERTSWHWKLKRNSFR